MPHIRDAMVRSLRASVAPRTDISGDVSSVKTTFSSWDGCMAKDYCKWPVIAAIIIGALIVISVVWCIVRCACCGLSCCCSCFSCLKCCGECCGCCDSKEKRHKHLDDYSQPAPFAPAQGYRAPAPMMSGGVAEQPKFATFEVGPNGHAIAPKAVHEDALPPMPSWDTATKTRVPTEDHEAMEMGELDPATGQKVPLMGGAAPMSRTPSPGISPVSSPYQGHDAYMANGALGAGGLSAGPNRRGPPMDPYGRNTPSELGTGPVRQGTPHDPYARNDPYNHNAYGNSNAPSELGSESAGWNPRSNELPAPRDNAVELESPMEPGFPGNHNGSLQTDHSGGGYQSYNDNGYQVSSPGGFDNASPGGYGGRGQFPNGGPNGPNQRFGPPQRQFSNNSNQSFAHPGPPQRQFSNDSSRPLMSNNGWGPPPARGLMTPAPVAMPYPDSEQQQQRRIASPPPSNNAGFDFGGNTPVSRGPPNMMNSYNGGGGNAAGPRQSPPNQGYRQPGPAQQQQSRYRAPVELASPGGQQSPYRPAPAELASPSGYAPSTAPPSYASRSPPPQQPQQQSAGYPGYRPYGAAQPQQQQQREW